MSQLIVSAAPTYLRRPTEESCRKMWEQVTCLLSLTNSRDLWPRCWCLGISSNVRASGSKAFLGSQLLLDQNKGLQLAPKMRSRFSSVACSLEKQQTLWGYISDLVSQTILYTHTHTQLHVSQEENTRGAQLWVFLSVVRLSDKSSCSLNTSAELKKHEMWKLNE